MRAIRSEELGGLGALYCTNPILGKKDIVLADRGYGSYQFFSEIIDRNAHFVIRCRKALSPVADALFLDTKVKEVITDLALPKTLTTKLSLPATLRVRFVRIPLDSGEIEVLATSLLDKSKFPYSDFKKLYCLRWNVETFFHVLKSRLCIDNFTGKSVEAIYQDFHSTIFVSGFETIITAQANETLKKRDTKHLLQVNKATSFHAIKSEVVKLLFDPPTDFDEKVTSLFLYNPSVIRKTRLHPTRKPQKSPNRKSLFFQRYLRKHVF